MEVNKLPKINMDKSETDCCPKFDPDPWDDKKIVFDNKQFVQANTFNLFHIPLNMGRVITKTWKAIQDAEADLDEYLMLSHDPSMWKGEHFFAVKDKVSGQKNVKLSGTYLTKVFEGPFKEAGKWVKEMEKFVESKDKKMKKLYFFYTTCPKCGKHYGKNYVVGFGQVE
ncbi:hydrolase [Patescibacteria group bacterium]